MRLRSQVHREPSRNRETGEPSRPRDLAAVLQAQRSHGNASVARALQARRAGPRRLQRWETLPQDLQKYVLAKLPVLQVFRMRLVNKDFMRLVAWFQQQIRATDDDLQTLLDRCPSLWQMPMDRFLELWRRLHRLAASSAELIPSLAFMPAQMADPSAYVTLLELVYLHPPPGALSAEQAARALAFQRPSGKASVDPKLRPDRFWATVLEEPVASSQSGRRTSKRKPEDAGPSASGVRAQRQDAALSELGRAIATDARIPNLETLATLIHNPHLTLRTLLDHRRTKQWPKDVEKPDTEATTCIALHRGRYLIARQNGIAMVPATFGKHVAALGLPGGAPVVVHKPLLALRVESSGVHGESMILRYLWLEFLTERGIADEDAATQAEFYIFYGRLARELVMGASQGICWDCAGNLAIFGVPHAVTPSEKPSPMWVDPVTQEQYSSATNRPQPGKIRTRFEREAAKEASHKRRHVDESAMDAEETEEREAEDDEELREADD